MTIHNNNIVPAAQPLAEGQRVIRVGEYYFPVGVGGNYIPGGTGSDVNIDLTGVDVTSDKLLDGVVAIGKDGNGDPIRVTGNILTVTANRDPDTGTVTVPVGYIAEEQTFEATVSGDGYDTSGVTAVAEGMREGLIAIGPGGETITGSVVDISYEDITISDDGAVIVDTGDANRFVSGGSTIYELEMSGDLVVEGNVVTVPAGYLSTDRVETLPEATVTETDSNVTITPGYLKDELSYALGSGAGESAVFGFMRNVSSGDGTQIYFQQIDIEEDSRPVGEPQLIDSADIIKLNVSDEINLDIPDGVTPLTFTTDDYQNAYIRLIAAYYKDRSNELGQLLDFDITENEDCKHYRHIYYRKSSMDKFSVYVPGTVLYFDSNEDYIQFYSQHIHRGLANPTSGDRFIFDINCPAEIYASGTVQSMFDFSDYGDDCFLLFAKCKSLVQAPEITIKYIRSSLVETDCRYMYYGCSSLVTASTPYVDAVVTTDINGSTLAPGYAYMFAGCSALSELTINFSAWEYSAGVTDGWLAGVSETGTVYKNPGLVIDEDKRHADPTSVIPLGWEITDIQ